MSKLLSLRLPAPRICEKIIMKMHANLKCFKGRYLVVFVTISQVTLLFSVSI